MQTDLNYLKRKVENGADYIVTQMFFDNQKFFDFVAKCREIGITVPIIPGLKPITTRKQLNILPRTFHVDIPADFSNEILKCKSDKDVEELGAQWLIQQSKELKAFGVPIIHYYTLGKPNVILKAIQAIS
jgi:methylenetetrahydrofolate reductase (NADPH)